MKFIKIVPDNEIVERGAKYISLDHIVEMEIVRQECTFSFVNDSYTINFKNDADLQKFIERIDKLLLSDCAVVFEVLIGAGKIWQAPPDATAYKNSLN